MASKIKSETDQRTQGQKFIDKARELKTDNSKEAFERALKVIATATPAKAKKAPTKKR